MGLRLVSIKPAQKTRKKLKLGNINLTPPKAKPEAITIFFRQLSTMLNAGIQLVDALEILAKQSKDPVLKEALLKITELVNSGLTFSEALKRYPKIFSTLVVSMIQAAELGGGMGKILTQISSFVEKEEHTRKKLKSATSYPKFVGGFFVIILSAVVFVLMPKFESIFADFGATLPLPTLMIMGFANFVKGNIILVVLIVASIIFGFKMVKRNPKGRVVLDKYKFSMPVMGNLQQKSSMMRITVTLSILMKSGVSLIEGLKIAASTADNKYIDEVVDSICHEISQGNTLGSQLELYPRIFPSLDSNMISIGEKSGALVTMLEKVSEFNDQEFNSIVDKMASILEPVIMAGLGVVATILVLGLYLPIFQMSSVVH
ncbi:MAG: type II secretion system F family protein [FCB group bacterium]|nr:type II secretion system F family protein [FCB group bacterium]